MHDDAGDYRDWPLRETLADLSSDQPLPAAGSAVAVSGALAAALVVKIARRSRGHRSDADDVAQEAEGLRDRLARLASVDAGAYARVLEADAGARAQALRAAAEPAAMIAEAGEEVARLAAGLQKSGNPNLVHDADAAAAMARTAADLAGQLAAANRKEAGP